MKLGTMMTMLGMGAVLAACGKTRGGVDSLGVACDAAVGRSFARRSGDGACAGDCSRRNSRGDLPVRSLHRVPADGGCGGNCPQRVIAVIRAR